MVADASLWQLLQSLSLAAALDTFVATAVLAQAPLSQLSQSLQSPEAMTLAADASLWQLLQSLSLAATLETFVATAVFASVVFPAVAFIASARESGQQLLAEVSSILTISAIFFLVVSLMGGVTALTRVGLT